MKDPYILNCDHTFDKKEIDKLLETDNQCPLCKKNISDMKVNGNTLKKLENLFLYDLFD